MHEDKGDMRSLYHDLAAVLEVHRDLAADVRLHLTDPPVGTVRVPDQLSGRKHLVHRNPLPQA
jgi:hypothetical protein